MKMTNEEAIFCEKSYIGETNCTNCKYYGTETCKSRESHKMAIKALKQQDILDKIRAKIEYHRNKTQYIDPYDLVGDCLEIIDECKKNEGDD